MQKRVVVEESLVVATAGQMLQPVQGLLGQAQRDVVDRDAVCLRGALHRDGEH